MKKILSCLLCICLLCLLCPSVSAAEDVISISSREDMLLLSAHPDGSFILTDDIDMRGDWLPIPFSGKLDGNGHTLYNLTVKTVGTDAATTFDGNRIEYETVFGGLFSIVSGAEICDLKLVNAVLDIETDRHCFVGTIAGYYRFLSAR